jgi:hypothetical protein
MSLFGPSTPKGITKKEAIYLRGRLMAGKGAERLSPNLVERIMELVDMALDADTYAERVNNVQQVSAEEAARIEQNLADDLSSTQQAYVRRIFQEFIDKNKVPGLF